MKKLITFGFASLAIASPVVLAVSCGDLGLGSLDDFDDQDDMGDGTSTTITRDVFAHGTTPGGVYVTLDVSNGINNFVVDNIRIDAHQLEEVYSSRMILDPRYNSPDHLSYIYMENNRPKEVSYKEYWDMFKRTDTSYLSNEWDGYYENERVTFGQDAGITGNFHSIKNSILDISHWGSFVDWDFTREVTGFNDEFEEGFTEAIWEQAFSRIPTRSESDDINTLFAVKLPSLLEGLNVPPMEVWNRWVVYLLSKITIDTSGMGNRAGDVSGLQARIDADLEEAQKGIDHNNDAIIAKAYGEGLAPIDDPHTLFTHTNEDGRIKPYAWAELQAAQNEWNAYCDSQTSMSPADREKMRNAIEFYADDTPTPGWNHEYRGALGRNGQPLVQPSAIDSHDDRQGHAWIKHAGFEGLTLPNDFYIPSVVEEAGRYVFRGATLPVGFTIPASIEVISRYSFMEATFATGYKLPNMDTAIALYMGNDNNAGVHGNIHYNGAQLATDFDFSVSPERAGNLYVSNTPSRIFKWFNVPTDYLVHNYDELTKLQDGGLPHSGQNGEGTLKLASGFTIPSSVVSIPENAFKDVDLTSGITIPTTVQSISSNAFQNAKLPSSFVIPSSVQTVTGNTFAGADVPSGFVADEHTYELMTFGGCTDSDLRAPVGMPTTQNSTTVGQYEGQTLQAGFALPAGIKYIAPNTFKGATLPEGFTLPSSVVAIGDSAFEGVTLPDSFRMPNTVNFIGQHAFYEGKLNEEFTLENTRVEYIGIGAFQETGVKNKQFSYDGGVQHFVMPDNFQLPNTLRTVDSAAFTTVCFLPGFRLPASLVNIERQAFMSVFSMDATHPLITIPTDASGNPAQGTTYQRWDENGRSGHVSPFAGNGGYAGLISGTGVHYSAFHNGSSTGRDVPLNYYDFTDPSHVVKKMFAY